MIENTINIDNELLIPRIHRALKVNMDMAGLLIVLLIFLLYKIKQSFITECYPF